MIGVGFLAGNSNPMGVFIYATGSVLDRILGDEVNGEVVLPGRMVNVTKGHVSRIGSVETS